jgi:hypothetical protein
MPGRLRLPFRAKQRCHRELAAELLRYMASSSHEAGAGGRCAVLRKDWTTRVALDLRLSNSTLEMFSAMLRRPLVQDGIIMANGAPAPPFLIARGSVRFQGSTIDFRRP